ncbi:MAG: HAMP domain-containing protein [Chloroflexi bacterium]|jgi:histidine kinase|nr:HAMP domain-containing protein [Chloroflexota bacterium]
MNYIRARLGLKLFLSYLAVLLVGVSVIWAATQIATPRAYARHLAFMEEQMGAGFMMGQGQGQGQGRGMMADFYENFQASFNEALLMAVLSATVIAVLVSWLLSRSIVSPVQAIMSASQRIAAGHYDERVNAQGADEIAQLAARFNQMASHLEQVETMRRQLIGDVTHELRTPLTSIKGYMEGLVDGVLPANAETFNQIHHEADRLSRLVDDLQELSRVESKAYSLDVRSVSVSSLVQTTLKRLSPQATAKRITLRSNLPADLSLIHADEDRITQVLVNLTANAIQYTPEDGEVTLSAARHGDEIHISVKDTGIGIPQEHLANIFTRFYRVDKSRSRNAGGGSGIGLTIARHIVEAHGGKIWVQSGGEGKGSTFSFSLKAGR